MSLGAPALLVAAAGVGFGHAILPDHWMPLAVVGRTQRYPLRRVARVSLLAGVAHVLVSVVLGAVIVLVGLQFRHAVQSAQDTVVGVILVLTGVAFAAIELTGHGHHHGPGGDTHDHEHHDHPQPAARGRFGGLAGIMVPFGAAASPDLTILPVFLAACASGVGAAVGSVVVFAAVTIGTIVGLTVAAARGGYQITGAWLERWGNAFTALVLITIGALVLGGIL
jgi:hypothetical protein